MNLGLDNNPYNTSFMEMRLNTTRILDSIEKFLRNKTTTIVKNEDTNEMVIVEKQIGEPLANELGILGIVNAVQMTVNEHTVQGNFDQDRYNDYMYWSRMELCKAIIINQINWEIKDEYLEMIIDSIMRLVEPFISRLLLNKERESYDMFSSRESVQQKTENFQGLSTVFGGK